MTWNTFPLTLHSSVQLTPTVRQLAFRRADREAFDYVAGQFINLHWDRDGQRTHRSYSVVTSPESSDLIEIAVAPVEGGFATGQLFGLEPGSMVEASGPYGRFVLRDDPPCRYLMIATGTGVTPYHSMLPELERRLTDTGYSAEVILGVRNRAELLYADAFRDLASRMDGFKFRACYSRDLPDDASDWECRGYVQKQFADLEVDPDRDIVYLCGNPNMVDEAVAALKQKGMGVKQVRREKYLSARN
ncbi:MAG: FAD-binding oxidoreductase [Gammaproteobacteria bacterium]